MVDLTKCYPGKGDAILTPRGRSTFVAVAEKWKNRDKPDDKGEFAVTLIFPKDCDLAPLRTAVANAAKAKFGDKAKGLRSPFSSAAEKLADNDAFKDVDLTGWTMLRANTYISRPGVAYANGDVVQHEDLRAQVYSGRWMRASVNAHAYDQNGNKGVKFYLNNLQLLDDDSPVGGVARAKPEDEFQSVEGMGAGTAADVFGAGGSSFP